MRELGIGVFDLLESLCNNCSNGFDFFSGLDDGVDGLDG
jgi:hypothetical protein